MTTTTTNPFDLESLRLSQDFSDNIAVKQVITTIPVRKPDRQTFFRVHPGDEFRFPAALIEIKEDRETYLVTRSLMLDLHEELVFKALLLAVTRQGIPFLLPVKLPGADGRLDSWNRSLMDAAERASKNWVRIMADMSLGAYRINEVAATVAEPIFPELTLQQIVEVAFKGRLIDSVDHPVVRRLRGESP